MRFVSAKSVQGWIRSLEDRVRLRPADIPWFLGRPCQQIPRLAVELAAQCFERRKANRARLVRFQHRQVRDRNADALRQVGQRQATVEEKMIELDAYGHLIPSDRQRLL